MPPSRDDRGSAAVDFVLLAPLVIGLCLAVVHVGMWVVAVSDAHRAAFAAARHGAFVAGDDDRRAEVARRTLAGDLPRGSSGTVRVGAGAGGRSMLVEVSVPLRVMDWDTPVRGSAVAQIPVENR